MSWENGETLAPTLPQPLWALIPLLFSTAAPQVQREGRTAPAPCLIRGDHSVVRSGPAPLNTPGGSRALLWSPRKAQRCLSQGGSSDEHTAAMLTNYVGSPSQLSFKRLRLPRISRLLPEQPPVPKVAPGWAWGSPFMVGFQGL